MSDHNGSLFLYLNSGNILYCSQMLLTISKILVGSQLADNKVGQKYVSKSMEIKSMKRSIWKQPEVQLFLATPLIPQQLVGTESEVLHNLIGYTYKVLLSSLDLLPFECLYDLQAVIVYRSIVVKKCIKNRFLVPYFETLLEYLYVELKHCNEVLY